MQDNTANLEEPSKKKRTPKRILHFSDGTLEEYSTDEDDKVDGQINAKEEAVVEAKLLPWGPWIWYQTSAIGTRTLEVCDYLGESLASFFGITTPKYQFEIDEYNRMVAEEEEEKKKMDLEMGAWTRPNVKEDEPTHTHATQPNAESHERLWTHGKVGSAV